MADAHPPAVTELLARLPEDAAAVEQLLPLIHEELKRIASRQMAGERPGHTLQTTALVNEAWLRLGGQRAPWASRVHFFAAAANTMRRVLVDHARARARDKRGGDAVRVTLDPADHASAAPDAAVLDLDAALATLASLDERKARCVELHYFGGLDYREIAEALAVSAVTVKRDLQFSRAWLANALGAGPRTPDGTSRDDAP